MALRTASITHLRYWKERSRAEDKARDVSSLPDGGDLLTFVYGVWRGLEPRRLWDRTKQFYCNVEAAPLAVGRTAVFTARVGPLNDPSVIEHVETGDVALDNDQGSYSNAVPQRMCLLVPEHATSAFLVIEHLSGGRLGTRFLEVLKAAWRQTYPGWHLHTETLSRTDAWLTTAHLTAVSARIYGHSADLADHGGARRLGTMQIKLVPESGEKYLPGTVRDAIVERRVSGSALLGTDEEPDELTITLGDGDQRKTFVIGKERTPAVRFLVTDYGVPALTDAAFRTWSVSETTSHFSDVGVAWNTGWNRGEWSPEALQSKVVVADE